MFNSIVAGNTDSVGGVVDDVYGGTFEASSSSNLVGAAAITIFPGGTGNQVGDINSPLVVGLASLDDYGGPTLTHALLPGSLAINAGDDSFLPVGTDFDQRGTDFDRVLGSALDIGAIEAQPAIDIQGPSVVDLSAPASDHEWTFVGQGSLTGSSSTVSVDWGDGSPIENVQFGVATYHDYSFDSPAGLEIYRITATITSEGIPTTAQHNVSIELDPFWFEESGGNDPGMATAVPTIDGSQVNEIKITEGDSFTGTLYETVDLATLADTTLNITLDRLEFPTPDNTRINDSIELALLDSSGVTVVPTIGLNRDAFFNLTETTDGTIGGDATTATLATSVNLIGGTVSIDVPTLDPQGQPLTGGGTLVYRVVNNDVAFDGADKLTTVTVVTQPTLIPRDEIWGVDQQGKELFKISNFDESSTPSGSSYEPGYVSYQKLKYMNDGSVSEIANDIESFSVSNQGIAYFTGYTDVAGDSAVELAMFAVDLNALGSPGLEVIADVVGIINVSGMPSGISSHGPIFGATTINPETGDLFAIVPDGIAANADQLWKMTIPEPSNQGAGLLITPTKVGDISDPSGAPKSTDATALSFAAIDNMDGTFNSNLYVVDALGDSLFQVDPTNAEILTTVDGNVSNDLKKHNGQSITSPVITAMGYDPISKRLIGIEDSEGVVVWLTLSNSVNSSLTHLQQGNTFSQPQLTNVQGISFRGETALALNVRNTPLPGPGMPPLPAPNIDSLLEDVSSGFDVRYAQTSFNESTDVLYANLLIDNNGLFEVRDALVVGVTNISDPSVTLFEPDGTTDDGIPYFTITQLATPQVPDPNGFFDPDDPVLIEDAELRFHNPDGVTFSYDVVVLGALNQSPFFTNEPTFDNVPNRIVEVVAGETFSFDFDATDPEGDAPLSYSIPIQPSGYDFTDPANGIVAWTPTAADVGKYYPVTMRVDDPFGGYDELSFNINVVSAEVSIADVTVNESDGTALLTVSISRAIGADVVLAYQTINGSATDGSDFTGTASLDSASSAHDSTIKAFCSLSLQPSGSIALAAGR